LALLPPFVDANRPVAPQIAVLAAIGITTDIMVGAAYIAAGHRLARVMGKPNFRAWLDRAIGAIFLLIALGVFVTLMPSGT
ncbi:MAG: hypothetical protein KDE55_16450, partial [Novosphingobium sp.]|nr:hypothetical protein [Novosphingobium sp.]